MTDLVIKDKFLHTLADKDFFEPISRYQANKSDFHDVVERLLPLDGLLQRYSYWWSCSFEGTELPAQGWKIHVSATPAHACAILDTVGRVLIENKVAFKFVADRMLLSLFNGKSFDRGSSGKFITIYPDNKEQFLKLIDELYEQTIGYWGPYILSDCRYKDSKVIYYRYGGILPIKRAVGDGSVEHVIKGVDGEYIADERTPYFNLPDGIEDPFQTSDNDDEEQHDGTLKSGRYKVERVLAFSNPGGVYLAEDLKNGERVVIKEGRPYTNVSFTGLDAVQLVKKEHRLLTLLADSGVTAKPRDFFLDWEHAYLVQEFLGTGTSLRGYLSKIYLTLKTAPTQTDKQIFWSAYQTIFIKIAEAFQKLHDIGIVFGDVSINNIMVLEQEDGDVEIKLIDFESAYEEGVDLPTHIFTPGYASESYENNNVATKVDDCYAIGALMMAGLFPMNALLSLDRNAFQRYMHELELDIGVPVELKKLIESLLSGKAEERQTITEVLKTLKGGITPKLDAEVQTGNFNDAKLNYYIQETTRYIASTADYSRTDRLFPADPEVLDSNPLSLGFGALGVAYVLHRTEGSVDQRIRDWIKTYPLQPNGCSLGLYNGLGGNAWCAQEIGEPELAQSMLDMAQQQSLKGKSPYVFDGLAGLGMTYLKFYTSTHSSSYLQLAVTIGKKLIDQAHYHEDGGIYWSVNDVTSASFGHGVAGIAQFFLYLHLATQSQKYLDVGESALDWVLAQGFDNGEKGLTWIARNTTPSYTPYWRWGSSGIGKVVLRYWAVTQKSKYADYIEAIHVDCNRKYTIFNGYFFGVTGIADFYIDLMRFEQWQALAGKTCKRIFSGTMLFAIDAQQGIAFPGESSSRISCDYGTGGAGVAMMLHRYKTQCESPFMVDELLPNWSFEAVVA